MVQLPVLRVSYALDDIAANCADSTSFKIVSSAVEVSDGDATREDRGGRTLDDSVGEAGAEEAIGGVDAEETVVDEKAAAHHSVDQQLLAECEGRVVGEHAFRALDFRRRTRLFLLNSGLEGGPMAGCMGPGRGRAARTTAGSPRAVTRPVGEASGGSGCLADCEGAGSCLSKLHESERAYRLADGCCGTGLDQ